MAIFSPGTTLLLDAGSGLTTVAEVKSIGGPELTCDDVETSNLSTSNVIKTYIAGWGDGGTVQISAWWNPAQFAILLTKFRTVCPWRIVFPQGSQWNFSGYYNSLKTDVELAENVEAPFTIKVTGAPTFTQ